MRRNHPKHYTTNADQGCHGANDEREERTIHVLRETSVLGQRLAGRGREGGAFLTMVIKGEGEDAMKRCACCLD